VFAERASRGEESIGDICRIPQLNFMVWCGSIVGIAGLICRAVGLHGGRRPT